MNRRLARVRRHEPVFLQAKHEGSLRGLTLQLPGDEVGGLGEGGVGIERRGIELNGVAGLPQRRRLALPVAGVALLDILQDALVYSPDSGGLQLFETPCGSGFRAGRDEELHGRVGTNHRADIPPIEKRAAEAGWRVVGEIALEGEEGGPDRGLGGHDRGGLRHPVFP